MRSQSVSVLNLSDVLAFMGFDDNQQYDIIEGGFTDNVTWGDSDFTLVNARRALVNIQNGVDTLSEFEGGSRIPDSTDIAYKFWGVVSETDYINVEE